MLGNTRGFLPELVNRLHTLPAALALDKEPIEAGRIYIAPPDKHLLIEKNLVRVTHGPKENRFRPAIDPLFRSAAYAYGSHVIGIVLSGALDDGTAGLWTVKRRGGIAIVQEPADAVEPSMPRNAIDAVAIDYRVPVTGMAGLLIELCNGKKAAIAVTDNQVRTAKANEITLLEVQVAMEDPFDEKRLFKLGELSKYTCPECHGVLTAIKEEERTRFRCHTGHAFSAESLLEAITEQVENDLWSAVRGIEERQYLLNDLGDHFSSINNPRLGTAFFNRAAAAAEKADHIKKLIFAPEGLDNIELS